MNLPLYKVIRCPENPKFWSIERPDGVMHHTDYGDREEALEQRDCLNDAFLLGQKMLSERLKG